MNKKCLRSLFLCLMLAATMLLAAGCGADDTKSPSMDEVPFVAEDGAVLGEGAAMFSLVVTDAEGAEHPFTVYTDAETVGAALEDLGMIAGEMGPYGLYVKMVNGITADYDTDGSYWSFYVNGEYAATGVDSTEVTDGADYEFRLEQWN